MKTSVETIDPVQVKLTVEVEPTRVKKAFDQAARELAKQVDLPGFRKGKVPRKLLEQRFGSGVVAQQAMEAALNDYYVEALRSEELDPVAQPEVDVDTFDEQEGCTFTATVQVRPTFDPPDHTGIGVTFPDWELTDDDIDEQLQAMRERFAEVDEVDRPAADGDLVTIDIAVTVDGEQVESAQVEDALYEIGSGGVTPKLDEDILGKQAGDEFTYEDDLPENFPEHAGRHATFAVTVKDVREKTLPDLDDDFATTVSEFDTLEELKDDLRVSLQRRKIQQGQHELRGRILEAYLARIDVPLPEAMVETEVANRTQEVQQRAEQYGMSFEEVLQGQGLTPERFQEHTRSQAESAVKAQLVLDQLAQELTPQLDQSDLDQEIVRLARTNNMEPQQVAQMIQEQGSMMALVGDIIRRKTIDMIVEAAEVDGGPDDDLLIELGLKQDPAEAEAADDEPVGDEPADDVAAGNGDEQPAS